MQEQTLVSLPVKELVKLPIKQIEDINWFHEMGMPAQGAVTTVIRRVVKVRKEQHARS